MAVLDILTYPDARLKQPTLPVTDFNNELKEFISDLEQTMDAGPGSVGIAAPQVNKLIRVAIVDVSSMANSAKKRKRRFKSSNHGRMVFINPEIVSSSGKEIAREGCLSVPDYTANVERSYSINIKTATLSEEIREFEFSGFEARAVLHELDHLDGILFLDRIISTRELFRRKVYK
jgi:peptide deformylase